MPRPPPPLFQLLGPLDFLDLLAALAQSLRLHVPLAVCCCEAVEHLLFFGEFEIEFAVAHID